MLASANPKNVPRNLGNIVPTQDPASQQQHNVEELHNLKKYRLLLFSLVQILCIAYVARTPIPHTRDSGVSPSPYELFHKVNINLFLNSLFIYNPIILWFTNLKYTIQCF